MRVLPDLHRPREVSARNSYVGPPVSGVLPLGLRVDAWAYPELVDR